ncbi:hypothetical protein [Chryseobacterium bernardetii]|uniref:hypothetical protein n=1 Tax=Chryseobacterium bernardetii TaxID=1241978 RepID=UPI003018AB01
MRKLLRVIMLLIITSCQSQSNIYKNIENLKNEYNEQNAGKIRISLGKDFKPTKTIIRKLKSELKSNNVIYVFSWKNTMPIAHTNKFRSLLYEIETQKKYYANNLADNYKDIVVENKGNQYFIDEEYILKEYLKMNNLDSLKPYEHQSNSAEMGDSYYLFDTKSNKVYYLEDLVFIKGKFSKYD